MTTVYAYNKKECTINKKVVKVTNVVNDNTVFLGDSITDFYNVNRYFNEYNIVNSGISGNTTKDILNDLDNRVYRYNPSKVVLLIGINDFLNEDDSVETVVNDIEEITAHLPSLKFHTFYYWNDNFWSLLRSRSASDFRMASVMEHALSNVWLTMRGESSLTTLMTSFIMT